MRKILLLLISSFLFVSGAFAQQDTLKSGRDSLPKTDSIRIISGAKVQITRDTIVLSEDPSGSSVTPAKGSNTKAGTVSRVTASGASDLGRTAGGLDVSPTGAATYMVPISVPPGINGVVPQIALSYNSQGGNGLAGYGWNVSGISSITRIAATMFHDGRVGSVNIDANDRYALDGQRLILKNGTYGADGAEYQTENYTNLKIISHGNSGSGSNYFEVDYPDGSIANYGYSTDSKTSTDWALSYTDNPLGIRTSYTYLQDNNTIAISQISYGAIGTATALNQINFVYQNRQRNEQTYIGGVCFFRTKILSEINVVANGAAYRNYVLAYDQVSSLFYERLVSITEKSGDKTKSFEPVNFSYANTASNAVYSGISNLSVGGISQSNASVITSDFTGDGTMDFILYPTAKNKIWAFWDPNSATPYTQFGSEINTGTFEEIFPVTWLTQNNKMLSGQGFVLVKYDSDYNVKFEVNSAGTVTPVYAQYNKLWSTANYQYYSTCTNEYKKVQIPRQFISGDFNGDGLTDVIAVNRPYNQITNGSGCNPQYNNVTTSSVHFINLDRRLGSNFVQLVGSLTKSLSGSDKLYAADVNGDGKTDIVHISAGVMYVYGLDENNNLTQLWQQTNDPRITTNYPALFGDYNGDGKTDIMFPTSTTSPQNRLFAVFLSTGKEFLKYEQNFPFSYNANTYSGGNLTTWNIIPSDINGDGKTDMISLQAQTKDGSKQGSISLSIFHNSGIASAQSAPTFTFNRTVTQTTTLIHYPIPVFLTSEKPNYSLELAMMSDNSLSWFKFQKDLRTDALVNSVNQDGVTHYIDYKNLQPDPSSSDIQIYESGYNQTFPNIDIQLAPGLKVVSAVRRSYNSSEIKQIFGYKGAVSNTEGIGFLGFSEVTRSNWHENYSDPNRLFTISMFNPDLRGAPFRSFIAKSAYITAAIKDTPPLPADITLSVPSTTAQTVIASQSITLQAGFSASSNDGTFIAQINNPVAGTNDSATSSDYITRTDYTYQTQLLPSKVFINMPTSVGTKDLLSGTGTLQTFTYDSYYNVSKEFNNFSGDGSKTTEITYDNSSGGSYYVGRPLTKKTTLTNGSDSYASEEQYSYSGSLPTQVKRKGNNTAFLTETLQYDGYGNVTSKTISTTSGAQRATQMQYDATGRFMTKATDAEGMETQFQYDASTGNLLTKTDPYGLSTSNAYDEWGRLTQTTDYLNNKSYRTYQKSGSNMLIIETDDEGSQKATTVNALGKTMEVKSKDVLGQIVGKAYQYDIYDRPTGESEPAISGSYNQWNTTAYDEYGRVKQTTSFTGKNTNISYSGLSATVNDGTKSVTTTKNALGNVISTQDPGGTISNTYFANGNLKSDDLGGSAQSIEQDGWGRKTKLTDPSAGVYTYTYNDFGDVTAETTPKGSTAYTYDANGKLQSKRVQGDNTDMSYSYTYDGASKLLTSLNLTNTDGNNAVYTYSYDSYKRPLSTVEDNTNARFAKTLTYDSYGRVSTEASDAKNKLNNKMASKTLTNNYQYGELKSISDNSGNNIWNVSALNARGQVTTALLGSALKETSTYDQYGMPQEIKTDRLGSNAALLMKLGYSFDAQRGNLNSRSNTAFSWNENFSYDNLDRLTNFNDNNSNQNQTYDGRGRIASNSNLGNYAYSGNSYRQTGLNNVTATAYTWYKSRPLQQISYNAFKSPVEIAEQGKEKVSFQYNAAEGRSAMYYGDTTADKLLRRYRKLYSEDGSMEIVNDTQAGSTSFVFYLGGDAYSAPAIWKEVHTSAAVAQNLYFLHRDHLGSILMITDANGNIAEKRQFDAWGNIVKLTDGNGNPLTAFVILDRGYTGHEHLFGVALIHMNGKLYDPMLHRFLSPDNFVQDPSSTQNFNRYGYVMNNPLSRVDKDGEFIWFIPALIGGVSNWLAHGAQFSWKGLGYFGVGAAAGVLGAGIGAGVNVSMAGGSFGVGFMGTAAGVSSTGFIAGAATGTAAGFTNGFVSGIGNTALGGGSFGESLGAGFKSGLGQGLAGGVTGGVFGGINSLLKGANFFTGEAKFDLSGSFGANGDVVGYGKISGKYAGDFHGADVYETTRLTGDDGITLPGRGILVPKGTYSLNSNYTLLQHEYGHILQARMIGNANFYGNVGVPSIFSAQFSANHQRFWTEVWANNLSFDYFSSISKSGAWPLRFPLIYNSVSDFLKAQTVSKLRPLF